MDNVLEFPTAADNETANRGGNFFAVDRRIWERSCGFGMNAAVTYLVLARGTSADNRRTAWSIQAIEKYTGISRSRSHDAMQTLQKNGLVAVLRAGTKPKYDLVPWSELSGQKRPERKPLTARQQGVYDAVTAGGQPRGRDKQVAYQLSYKGWLIKSSDSVFSTAPEPPRDEADWIWLPNELVSGAANEIPPVELVRQTQEMGLHDRQASTASRAFA